MFPTFSITAFNTLHGDYYLDSLQPLFLKTSTFCRYYLLGSQSYAVMTVLPFITYSCIHGMIFF